MAARSRTRDVLLGFCSATAISLSALPAVAQQAPMTQHLRPAVALGLSPLLRPLSATQTMKISLDLPLRHRAELETLLGRLSDPQSPSYRKFLSVVEFTSRFGPTQQDYDAVLAFARAHNLKVTGTPANRMLVDVSGTVADIQRALHVRMNVYRNRAENRDFYAPDREPAADLPFPLWHISGLDNFSPPRPRLRHAQPDELRRQTTGSGPGGQFVGSDFRAAYYGGSALTGAGQSIGIYGLPYDLSDVQKYFSTIGQSFDPSVVQNASDDGTQNVCNGCDDGEPVVDIVSSFSMAPGVSSVIEYFGSNTFDIFNAMASDDRAKQLSVSIGYYPADPTTEEPIFQEFAAQGQNVFVASGDSGAYPPNSQTTYAYPADDPYVTAVGGTDLTTNGSGGSWQSETAWIGSSGGASPNNFPIPAYQQLPGVINASNGGSTTVRNLPDVAAEANDDNWFCAAGNCQGGLGGTSFAAPRWAGFMALINQQATQNGSASVGFLNPIIYAIGVSSSYGSDFHDITFGNNNNSIGGFSAVPGYDLVTGWGSPNGQAMIDAIATGSPPASDLSGTFTVNPQNAHGLVLDDWESGTGAGNQIDIWPANGTGAQSWRFSSNGVSPAGDYNIAVSYGAYCLAATGTTAGSPVALEPCDGSASQAWHAAPSGAGYSFNPASNTALCLDVRGNATAPETIVQAWTCTGGSNQQWVLN